MQSHLTPRPVTEVFHALQNCLVHCLEGFHILDQIHHGVNILHWRITATWPWCELESKLSPTLMARYCGPVHRQAVMAIVNAQ